MIYTILLNLVGLAIVYSAGYCTALWFASKRRKEESDYFRVRITEARYDGWRAGHKAALSGLTAMENRKVFQADFSQN